MYTMIPKSFENTKAIQHPYIYEFIEKIRVQMMGINYESHEATRSLKWVI